MSKEKMYSLTINEHVIEMAKLAREVGIDNILQPGLLKEMIVADHLNHKLICSKRDADACSMGDPNEKYEYLSFKEGGSGQLDRMFKEPVDKRANSLNRITRNTKIYFPIFYEDDQTKCKIIYEVEPNIALVEAEHQLDQSSNSISHVGFSEKWVEKNGNVVYQNG